MSCNTTYIQGVRRTGKTTLGWSIVLGHIHMGVDAVLVQPTEGMAQDMRRAYNVTWGCIKSARALASMTWNHRVVVMDNHGTKGYGRAFKFDVRDRLNSFEGPTQLIVIQEG